MPPSLKSLMGTLTNAAPVEFDPEAQEADAALSDEEAMSQTASDEDPEEEEHMNPRAHYAKVGSSQMRKKAALSESEKLRDPRYQGVKSSRADMLVSNSEESSDEEISEGSVSDEDQSEDEDEDVEQSEASSSQPDKLAKPRKQLRFAELQSDEDVAASKGASIAAQMTQSAAQAKSIKQRRLQDAEKGRHVRKQVKTFDRILESRIKAQSVLREVNRLPVSTLYESTIVSQQGAPVIQTATQVLEQLLELSEKLFTIRTRLNKLNAGDEDGSATPVSETRKRKRDFDIVLPDDVEHSTSAGKVWKSIQKHEQISATVQDVLSYSRAAEPQRRQILDKWSLKVTSAASAASANGANKFQSLKAVNQTPSAQIDSALSGDGLHRLVMRTRTLRGENEAALKLGAADTAATSEVQDVEVFDDSDFYSHLLKELIDRRSGSSELLTAASTHGLINGKKKRANVDTKASKGRKLRYDVNDKVVSFMPPMKDRLKWGEEQIDRLFRQLAASSQVPTTESQESEAEEEEADLGGLRVFG